MFRAICGARSSPGYHARHGYEIAKLIDARSAGRIRFKIASLYPLLYRLEHRG